MAGYNRIVMVGNLTRDPDYKQLNSGQAVCRLGLATNRQFRNRQTGTMVQEVCYVDIDVWGPQAESCRQYLQKGRPVLIEGRLKFDTWEDQQGQTRSKHSIVADRVVFLTAGAAQEDSEEEAVTGMRATAGAVVTSPEPMEPQSELERNLLDQIKNIKGRASSKAKKAEQTEQFSGGELNFKDNPPFEDDLPF